jgi:hypothetical protein
MNEEHLISVGIVAKSHGASEIRLRQLHYSAEQALLNLDLADVAKLTTSDTTVSLLKPVGIEALVGIATDVKTGWFVQLVSQKDKPMLMTIGRKYCMSGYDGVNQMIATKMWS